MLWAGILCCEHKLCAQLHGQLGLQKRSWRWAFTFVVPPVTAQVEGQCSFERKLVPFSPHYSFLSVLPDSPVQDR